MAGPTLTQIRQRIAQWAGVYTSGVATSNSTTSLLADTAWPAASSISQASLYKDCWIFIPTAAAGDQVRICKLYEPTAAEGDFTPDANWGTAPYSAGVGKAYEVHAVFEPLTAMTRMINQGLKECWIPVEFSFQAASNTATRHSLATAAPWLHDDADILKVGVLSANSQGRDVEDPYGWGEGIRCDTFVDGATVYVSNVNFNVADTVYVKAMSPAYYHCAAVGSPTVFTQSGLALEGDVVPDTVSLEWVAAAALVQGWLEYGATLDQNDRVKLSQREAAIMFGREDPGFSARYAKQASPIKHWGPSNRGYSLLPAGAR